MNKRKNLYLWRERLEFLGQAVRKDSQNLTLRVFKFCPFFFCLVCSLRSQTIKNSKEFLKQKEIKNGRTL